MKPLPPEQSDLVVLEIMAATLNASQSNWTLTVSARAITSAPLVTLQVSDDGTNWMAASNHLNVAVQMGTQWMALHDLPAWLQPTVTNMPAGTIFEPWRIITKEKASDILNGNHGRAK